MSDGRFMPMDMEAWRTRQARRQVNEKTLQDALAEKERKERSGRNIWTGRTARAPPGESGPGGRPPKERSIYRCIPQVDSGRTKGSDAQQRTFCIYFAKGCCAQGPSCIYLHRVPNAEDEAYHSKDMGSDIFGREKRAEHEGFRKGAGTFERDNRTIYVNYEGAGSYDLPRIRELLQNNFAVWGPIKSLYIAHKKTIAFVKYEWRSSAEFAKEAMHKQGLIGSSQAEILTCRWSNEDPKKEAVEQKKRDYQDAFETAALASWDALPEEQKAARIMQLQLAATLKKKRVVADYPDTDGQYASAGAGQAPEDAYPDTDAQYGGYAGAQYDAYGQHDAHAYAQGYGAHPGTSGQYGAGAEQGYGGYGSGYGAQGGGSASAEHAAAGHGAYYYSGYGSGVQGAGEAAACGGGAQGGEAEGAGAGAGAEDGASGLGLLACYGGSGSDEEEGGEGGKKGGEGEKEGAGGQS